MVTPSPQERDRQTDRDRRRETERDTDRQRETEGQRTREREKRREREAERKRQTERKKKEMEKNICTFFSAENEYEFLILRTKKHIQYPLLAVYYSGSTFMGLLFALFCAAVRIIKDALLWYIIHNYTATMHL